MCEILINKKKRKSLLALLGLLQKRGLTVREIRRSDLDGFNYELMYDKNTVIDMRKKSMYFRFSGITKLYHFTSFDSASKIIQSGKLRFSKSYRLNDLIESNRVVWERSLQGDIPDGQEYLHYAEVEMRRYQQISFSQDRVVGNCYYLGFDLHTMWGLYADSGYGVCLVFDKEKLTLGPEDYAAEVKYVNLIPQGVMIHNKSKGGIKSEIKRRRESIFYYKRKEWEYEQEYRILRRAKNQADDEYLDITETTCIDV